MTEDRDAQLLAIRAVDGELGDAERARLERLLAEEPDLRAFHAREQEAARAATNACRELARRGNGLEKEVLKAMGLHPRLSGRRRLALAAAAMALLAIGLLALEVRDGGGHPRATSQRRSAHFAPVAGPAPEAAGEGVYHLADGTAASVEVERPTLVSTPHGVIELAPGSYDLRAESDRVVVGVRKGTAVLRAQDGTSRTVTAGGTAVLEAGARAVPEVPNPAVAAAVDAAVTRLVGRVVDGAGEPVSDARIWASDGPDPQAGTVLVKTDAQGVFAVDAFAGTVRWVGARAAGRAPSDLRRIEPAARAVFELEIALRHPGGALSLRLVAADGRAVGAAGVTVGSYYRDEPGESQSAEGLALGPTRGRALATEADGSLVVDDLPPGWMPVRVRADGFAPVDEFVRVPPGGRVEKTVTLAAGAVIRGRVADESGAPVVDATVELAYRHGQPVADLAPVRTDAEGGFVVADAPVGKVEVRVTTADGRRATAWIETQAGKETAWAGVVAAALALEGSVRYEDGSPVAGAQVWARRVFRTGADAFVRTLADADGRFGFEGLLDAVYEVWVWYPGPAKAALVPPERTVRVRPAEGALTLRLPLRDAEPEPGSLRGTLVTPDGAAGRDATVRLWPAGRPGWSRGVRTGEDGAFLLDAVAPGEYELEIHLDGHPTIHRTGIVVEAGRAHDLGNVALPAPGRIRVQVYGIEGEPLAQANVWVTSLDQRIYFDVRREESGTTITEGLAPGRYLVGGGMLGHFQEVEVAAGQTVAVDVRLTPSHPSVFEVVFEDGRKPQEMEFVVKDTAGRRVFQGSLDHGENETTVWLMSGTYRFEAKDAAGAEGSIDFTVDADHADQHLRVSLR